MQKLSVYNPGEVINILDLCMSLCITLRTDNLDFRASDDHEAEHVAMLPEPQLGGEKAESDTFKEIIYFFHTVYKGLNSQKQLRKIF